MTNESYPPTTAYLSQFLGIQPESEDENARYHYRDGGEIWIGTMVGVFVHGAGEGDEISLGDAAAEAESQSQPKGWSSVILCLAEAIQEEFPGNVVAAAMMVFPDGQQMPASWTYEGAMNGFRVLGSPTFVTLCSSNAIDAILSQAAQRLTPFSDEASIRQVMQEAMSQLQLFLIEDHFVTEGWATLSTGEKDRIDTFLVRGSGELGGSFTYVRDSEQNVLAVILRFEE